MKHFTFLLLFFSLSTLAQVNLTGTVTDSTGSPVAFANVVLLDVEDASLKYGTSTDESGNFSFSKVVQGDYDLQASFVGYVTLSRKLTLSKDTTLNNLVLETDAAQLDAVTLTVKRPTVDRKPDRIIFNVENTTLSTGNAAQILKSTPGIFEMNGSYMVQNRPAAIYINNKRVYISNEELQQLLNGYSGDNVKSVEVITNPPAQYDADGGAVINIITSKNVSLGYKGAVTGNWTIDTFAKYQLGTSQFYKNNWLNVYANYNYNPRKDLTLQESQVGFFNNDGTRSSRWFTDFENVQRSQAHNLNTTIDITLNEKNSLSITGNLSVNNGKELDVNVNTLILDQGATSFSGFNTQSDLGQDLTNGFVNLGWNSILNEKGGSINVEAGYVFTENDNSQNLLSSFFDSTQTTTGTNSFNTLGLQEIDILTGKIDYSNQLGEYGVTAGVKYSNISSQSKQDFFDTDMGSTLNPSLSDKFLYDESIYAVYTQLERAWTKWSFTGGIRLEQTEVEGDSESLGLVNTQEYLGVFPNLAITHALNDNHELTLSYKRSIERPRYQDLNPFNYFVNDNNVNSGNPNLRPAFTDNINLNWNIKNTYFIDTYFTYTKSILNILPFQNNDTNVLLNQSTNLNYEFQYSIDGATYQYFNEHWFAVISTSAFYMENEFKALQSANENQKLNTTGLYLQSYNQFSISKDDSLNMEVELGYLSSILFGSYKYENMFSTSVGFTKSLWKDRGILTVKYSDPFLSQNQPMVSRYANQDNRFLSLPETQTLSVGFTYKFGNFRLENREVEAPEEQERTTAQTKGL